MRLVPEPDRRRRLQRREHQPQQHGVCASVDELSSESRIEKGPQIWFPGPYEEGNKGFGISLHEQYRINNVPSSRAWDGPSTSQAISLARSTIPLEQPRPST